MGCLAKIGLQTVHDASGLFQFLAGEPVLRHAHKCTDGPAEPLSPEGEHPSQDIQESPHEAEERPGVHDADADADAPPNKSYQAELVPNSGLRLVVVGRLVAVHFDLLRSYGVFSMF